MGLTTLEVCITQLATSSLPIEYRMKIMFSLAKMEAVAPSFHLGMTASAYTKERWRLHARDSTKEPEIINDVEAQ